MQIKVKTFSLFIVFLISFFFVVSQKHLSAQTTTPTVTPTPDNGAQVSDLSNKIKDLEAKVSDLQSQEKSLSSQISVMDNQIKLTEYRIDDTKEQITELTHDIESATERISHLEGSLTNITKTLLNRISATYQLGSVQPLQLLLSSQNFTDFIAKTNYIRIVQAHDKEMMYNTVQAKNDYANQKNIFEDKKKKVLSLQTQLESYTEELDSEKVEKQRLLSETEGSEANYQRILSQTRAQLAGFQGFVTSQGGASLLGNQTTCDDWGCYYNQRDSQWGGNPLNGTQYTLASDGCLVTSMAMVYTHYGHRDVTPQTINSVSSNFGGIPAALLRFDITANGISSHRVSSDIDSTLASGNPVIIGISYDGGGLADHFLVLISGSGGNYMMNDPFTPNGHNISFRGRYPTVRIVQYYKVNI
jgi:peptidoglycan hydrolase CwlO-like protein